MHEGYLSCTWNYNLYDPHSVENEKTTSMTSKENTSLILCLKSQTNYIEKATDLVTFITVRNQQLLWIEDRSQYDASNCNISVA